MRAASKQDMTKLGIQVCFCFFLLGWLGSMSVSVSLVISPLTVAICRRKSTRLTAVMGGLVTALGCLFTSFASQFHQLFFSYGIMIGRWPGGSQSTDLLS